jgi:ubiquitin C-terminal hydrolase
LRKTDTVVEFPVSGLDLAPYASAPCALHPKGSCACSLYDLHALIQHSGELGNMDSGHYVCFVRHAGLWFKFDDALVCRVSEEEVGQRQAYLLMYTKRQ